MQTFENVTIKQALHNLFNVFYIIHESPPLHYSERSRVNHTKGISTTVRSSRFILLLIHSPSAADYLAALHPSEQSMSPLGTMHPLSSIQYDGVIIIRWLSIGSKNKIFLSLFDIMPRDFIGSAGNSESLLNLCPGGGPDILRDKTLKYSSLHITISG